MNKYEFVKKHFRPRTQLGKELKRFMLKRAKELDNIGKTINANLQR